ncbi:MAG: hypothetical protein WKG32_04255 [Gemmatimonadaceae bacterium]
MSRVEEMTTVRVSPAQAMRALVTRVRFTDWMSPSAIVTPLTSAPTLSPGDRFRLDFVGGVSFEYLVETTTDREIVFAFTGPWSGEERWSFIADGDETIVRRVYEVRDGGMLALLAWQTVGRALVLAHFKFELMRFRDVVERTPGARAEIGSRPMQTPVPPAADARSDAFSYPVDEG